MADLGVLESRTDKMRRMMFGLALGHQPPGRILDAWEPTLVSAGRSFAEHPEVPLAERPLISVGNVHVNHVPGSPPRGKENVRMNHREEQAEVRGAVYRGDGRSLVGILKREAGSENALQVPCGCPWPCPAPISDPPQLPCGRRPASSRSPRIPARSRTPARSRHPR